MKSAGEFFDRLRNDEAFAKEVSEELKARREGGAGSYYDTFIPTAEKFGYLITKEDIDEMVKSSSEELSEEELGKVAGGASCLAIVTILTVIVVTASSMVTLYEATVNMPESD